jgi:hypothetical protein
LELGDYYWCHRRRFERWFPYSDTIEAALLPLPSDAFDEPLLDFFDLKRRKIVKNHTHLKNLIQNHGFPPGFWVGPNSHRWTPQSVRDWLASRPTGPSPHVQARAAKSAAVRKLQHCAKEMPPAQMRGRQ